MQLLTIEYGVMLSQYGRVKHNQCVDRFGCKTKGRERMFENILDWVLKWDIIHAFKPGQLCQTRTADLLRETL